MRSRGAFVFRPAVQSADHRAIVEGALMRSIHLKEGRAHVLFHLGRGAAGSAARSGGGGSVTQIGLSKASA